MPVSPRGDRLVLWYRLQDGVYDVSAERRGDDLAVVRTSIGKVKQTRAQMLDFFFAQIKQEWVRCVYVDANSGIEREITERTVSRIRSGEFEVKDLLV